MRCEGPNRVVLFGLDGATFSILSPLMENGTMPFLGEFAAQGARGILRSTSHPLTPPAWTSIMTGRSPGNHGIFDFVKVDRKEGPATYTLVTSADVRCETLWSIASRQNYRVTVLNFPCMFPPQEVRGFIIPGYVPWSYLPRAVYPRDLYQRLKSKLAVVPKELATDWDFERKAVQGLPMEMLETWVRTHIDREQRWFEVAEFLMREEPCELTAVLFDGVDRIQHLCYHFIEPTLAARHTSAEATHLRSLCLEYFRRLDHFLERLSALAGPEALKLIASDHGFTAAGERIFYANTWLQQHGYLTWATNVPADEGGRVALENHSEVGHLFDWSGTTAYALTSASNAIYIGRGAGRNGSGGERSREEYRAFRDRLVRELLAYNDPATGKPIIQRVLTREEAFPGHETDRAPDLTLLLQDWSFLSVLRAKNPVQNRPYPCGTHHPDGIFFARGPGIRAGVEIEPSSILNITPTALYGLGLPIPDNLEAPPVTAAFDRAFVERHPVRSGSGTVELKAPAAQRDPTVLEPNAEAEVLKQLNALGYL